MTAEDRIQKLAEKQSEWMNLPLQAKTKFLQEILARLSDIPVETFVEKMGCPDATMKGFPLHTDEGKLEATEAVALYAMILHSGLSRLLHAYQNNDSKKERLETTTPVSNGSVVAVQTFPLLNADKYGPFAKVKTHVWIEKTKEGQDEEELYFPVESTLTGNRKSGVMVFLGAGNQLFLSAMDSLDGLFVENSVVFLKHHPLRGHQDRLLRQILQPLIERGYFDSEVDCGLERTKEIIYHPSVSKVHLTGGKATHDAIVWGSSPKRDQPILKAQMTSELGCVTPWIVAPQELSEKELDHQTKHLFFALYSNAGANCNSPKVVILIKNWIHTDAFVSKLKAEMEKAPLPVAYYPGSRDRWNAFRKAYPTAKTIGDTSSSAERGLSSTATVLPWLVTEDISVDLTTPEGRERASKEYAFRNEPFAPVLTIVKVDSLEDAVTLSNEYIFGSLSCTVVASQSEAPDVEQAITKLKYGAIGINTWSAICYFPLLGCIWGAYPGEDLKHVESGIGLVHNFCFLKGTRKSVMCVRIVDPAQSTRKPNQVAARNELQAIVRLTLKPGVTTFLNLIAAISTGYEIPSFTDVFNTLLRLAMKPMNMLRQY